MRQAGIEPACRREAPARRARGNDFFITEGRTILDELDATTDQRPNLWRRGWRRFRQTPPLLQVIVGLVLFVGWAYLVYLYFR
jgi:hypothetical protein